jgi:glycosyltransferase involved in cell wall biosynthesis
VLAYATGGIPYANRNGQENVVLVDRGDIESLAKRAIDILENDEYREALSVKLRALAADEFSLERNVSRIVDAYDVMLEKSPNGNSK